MRRKRATVWVLGIGAAVALAVGARALAEVEEPAFSVDLREGDFEVRRYQARVVAETRVVGSWDEAGSEGFRRLAGYIFGGNRGRTKIAMTAPVGERASGEAVKIPMTAPVGERAEDGAWVVSFTMPAGETLASLPEPNDARVTLRELAPCRVAVVRFSGRWNEDRIASKTKELREWAKKQRLVVNGDPEVNRYDPPYKPWFLRRNEVWLSIEGA